MKNWAHFQFLSAFIRSDQCEALHIAPGPGTPPLEGDLQGEVFLESLAVYSLRPALRALPTAWWKVGLARRGFRPWTQTSEWAGSHRWRLVRRDLPVPAAPGAAFT